MLAPDFFLSSEKVQKELLNISSIVTAKFDHNNGDEVSERLAEFVALRATAGHVLSSAEKLKNDNPKVTEYKALFTYADQLSKSVSYGIDGLRSILSKIKDEKQKSTYGGLLP